MFKKLILILVLVSLCFSTFALDMNNAEPYDTDSFPKWSLNIRRSEIIFFGALPITYPFTALVTDALNSNLSCGEKLGISAGAAAGIVLADIIIGLATRK